MKLLRSLGEIAGVLRPAYLRSCFRGDTPDMRRWIRRGKPAPAPPTIKRAVLDCYRRAFLPPVFVETGTYEGDTVYAFRDRFRQLYTIELSPELHKQALVRLATVGNIRALQGDSAEVLPTILAEIKDPCLFWLDGHYSGGKTAKGKVNCPLLQELALIMAHPIKRHIILMDDARLFGKLEDYPSAGTLVEMGRRGGYDWELHYDILCLIPNGSPKLAPSVLEAVG